MRPTPRWRLSYELVQRGALSTLRLRLVRDRAPVVPTSLTVRVIAPDGSDALAATAATPGQISTYVWDVPAELELGEGYVTEWAVTVDGEVYTYTVPTILVLRLVDPIVTDEDVWRRWPHLNPQRNGAMTREPTWQDQIDEAWIQIQTQMIASGRRPYLLATSATLRTVHLDWAGAIIMETIASRGGPAAREDAERLRDRARHELDTAIIQYADEDGRAGKPSPSARGSVYLATPRSLRYGGW